MPATSNLPQRSGKASLYDGGTREPCIIVWPGKIAAGSTNDALFQSTDFYPTLLAMCGLRPKDGVKLDGMDQSGMLAGGARVRDRLFCHFPHGSEGQAESIPGFKPGSYVRKEDWKLVRFFADNEDGSDRLELYDLKQDPGESKDVAQSRPEVVKELNGLLDGFLSDTEAVIPVRNPGYGKAPKVAGDPLQGWKARSCEAVVKDGILTMKAKGVEPFLGYAAGGMKGPTMVAMRVRCAEGGAGHVDWIPSGVAKSGADVNSVPVVLKGGDWEEVAVTIPAEGPLGIVRLYLPAATQPVEVDWIELRASGKPTRWGF
jgi:hypothetical protein